MFWCEHPFGGFTHDVCRSGKHNALQRYRGWEKQIEKLDSAALRGARLWLQPCADEAATLVSAVQEVWSAVDKELAATLLVHQGVAEKLELGSRDGWSLKYSYQEGLPVVSGGQVVPSVQIIQVWELEGVAPSWVLWTSDGLLAIYYPRPTHPH